ncbi:putative heat-labile enterotoxin [Ophiocordyceps camponoti-leonardi (nom. inval.)]|nr:putative heat-labile enterotoxin [Ophiocordyceps camponoti-leonardi (nom. inval.)]
MRRLPHLVTFTLLSPTFQTRLPSPPESWAEVVAKRAIDGPSISWDPHGIILVPSDVVNGHPYWSPDWDGLVYRGDARTPSEIEAAGGFRSRFAGPVANAGAVEEWVNPYSLFSHVKGKIENTVYISTTLNTPRAAFYAINSLGKTAPKDRTTSYVYQIQADGKTFVDVNRSLRLRGALSNFEVAAMDLIPWSSVKGWTQLSMDQLKAIEKSESVLADFASSYTANPEYKPVSHPGMSTRPQLAGWPRDSTAWKAEPWRTLRRNRKAKDLLNVKAEYERIKVACAKLTKRDGSSCLEGLVEPSSSSSAKKQPKPGVVKAPTSPKSSDRLGAAGKAPPGGPDNGGKKAAAAAAAVPGGPAPAPAPVPVPSNGGIKIAPSSPSAGPCKGNAPACVVTLASVPAREKSLFARGLKNFEAMYDNFVWKGLQYKAGLQASVYGSYYTKSLEALKPKIKGLGTGFVVGTLIGLPFSVHDIVNAFVHDLSDVRKAAAVLSVVPLAFVSCTAQLATYTDEYHEISKSPIRSVAARVDITYCAVGDFLLFTPLMPIGIMIHVARVILGAVAGALEREDEPTVEKVIQLRYEGWKPYKTQLEYLFVGDEWRNAIAERRDNATAFLSTYLSLAKAVLDEEMANLTANDKDQYWKQHNAIVDAIWELEDQFCVAQHRIDGAWKQDIRDRAKKMVLDLSKSYQESWAKVIKKEFPERLDRVKSFHIPPWEARRTGLNQHVDERRKMVKDVFSRASDTPLDVTDTLRSVMRSLDLLLGPHPDLPSNRSCLAGQSLWPDVKKIWPNVTEDLSPDIPSNGIPVAGCQQPCQGDAVLKVIDSSQCYDRRPERKLAPHAPSCCPFEHLSLARVTDRLRPHNGWENPVVSDPSGAESRFALLEKLESKAPSASSLPSSSQPASSDIHKPAEVWTPSKATNKPWQYGEVTIEEALSCSDEDNRSPDCVQWVGTEIFCGRQSSSKDACFSEFQPPPFLSGKQDSCKPYVPPYSENCVGTTKWCQNIDQYATNITTEECLRRRPPPPDSTVAADHSSVARPEPPVRGSGVQFCNGYCSSPPEFFPPDKMNETGFAGGPCRYIDIPHGQCIDLPDWREMMMTMNLTARTACTYYG